MKVSRGFYLFVITFGTLLTAFQLYFTRPPLLAWFIMAVALAIGWFIGLKRSGWPWGHRKSPARLSDTLADNSTQPA